MSRSVSECVCARQRVNKRVYAPGKRCCASERKRERERVDAVDQVSSTLKVYLADDASAVSRATIAAFVTSGNCLTWLSDSEQP